jgi:D-glycero-D-manno-heptose 1,7-bisphosphate phosphatase
MNKTPLPVTRHSSPVTRPAVFLDRDGVINKAIIKNGKPYPPNDLSELEVIEGVGGALQSLKEAGFLLIVVTNQPDVARGTQKREIVESMNAALRQSLPIDGIFVCYHDDRDDCSCRKPKPGLLQRATDAHAIDLAASFMVGDRWKDVEAGRRAGCTTILVDYQYAEKGAATPPDCRVRSLAEAAAWICQKIKGGKN